MEIFRRKKRAGIAVRVGERAWDLAAKPTDDAYYLSLPWGYKTNQTVPIAMNFGSAVLRTDARLSFRQSIGGPVVLAIHGIRQQPDLDKLFFGHIFSEEDKKNLRESGNMGRVVELKTRSGEYVPSFISLDKLTNEVVAMRAESAFIPNEIGGVELTAKQVEDLNAGKAIFVEDLQRKDGEFIKLTS